MDDARLERIQEVAKQAELIKRKIKHLEEAVAEGPDLLGITLKFDVWGVDVWRKPPHRGPQSVCWAGELKEDSEEFRQAFLSIVEKRLEYLKIEYSNLSV